MNPSYFCSSSLSTSMFLNIRTLIKLAVTHETSTSITTNKFDKENYTYINHHQVLIIHMWVHEQRRPACRTELMHALLLPKEILFHEFLASIKHDVRALGVDVQIAVLAAYGAVAVHHFLAFDWWCQDFVSDSAAVAIGFVPDLGGGFGCGHDKRFGWDRERDAVDAEL